MTRAVVLLSGGLDSTTALYLARAAIEEVYALTVGYGQRHDRELRSASAIARAAGVREHRVLRVDLTAIAPSALTNPHRPVPSHRSLRKMGLAIPSTYVPGRNTILLAMALAYAETVHADRIYIGANALDYSGYPDCRPEYYRAFQRMANLATKRGIEGHPIRIETPLIRKTKADIVRLGTRLGVPFELTWSCYLGGNRACGECDSCQLRLKGFREAGMVDPLPYTKKAPRNRPRRTP